MRLNHTTGEEDATLSLAQQMGGVCESAADVAARLDSEIDKLDSENDELKSKIKEMEASCDCSRL